MEKIAGLIYEYGGWGLSTILMMVVWRMASYIVKMHRAQLQEQKEDNRELVEALVSTRQAVNSFKETLNALASKL